MPIIYSWLGTDCRMGERVDILSVILYARRILMMCRGGYTSLDFGFTKLEEWGNESSRPSAEAGLTTPGQNFFGAERLLKL